MAIVSLCLINGLKVIKMGDIEKAILHGIEACLVKLHVHICPECKKKYKEILKHIKESAKDAENMPLQLR